jgi:subtilase family serine protease
MPSPLPRSVLLFSLLAGLALPSLIAQAKPQITSAVKNEDRIALPGNVHPLLKHAQDMGIPDTSTTAGRMVLVLKPSEESKAALQQYLLQAHSTGSSSYHKWLSPTEFGERFGAATSDIEQVRTWLESQGLTVTRTLPGRLGIEFTGTIGQVGAAFQTSIHTFQVNGETHRANISNPKVPAAFARAVRGVSSLNDFRLHSNYRTLGKASLERMTHQAKAEWTTSNGSQSIYVLSPGDFANQYNLNSTYSSGITGKGQIIGIINDSNVDTSLVDAYRALFGLSTNTPQVVVDGDDPGITTDAGEAYLDLENAGAAAPDATIRLYVAGSYGLDGVGGLLFALNRAIDDNEASILSVSFGACEQSMGDSTNAYVNQLMAQAAAQGQTVLVSTGDSGSAGCDRSYETQAESGLSVNGLASTPWNVAVGGTDFYYSDYASGGASIANYWNVSNANYVSLQKQIPEQPWNDSVFGKNLTAYAPLSNQTSTIAGGGGGKSSCISSSTDANYNVTCLAGYSKPAWQAGTNVPADGVRDIPDVSLFASDGSNGSSWPVCEASGECVASSSGSVGISLVGGTSASTPSMAGILALVNQKYGRLGQANFVLYPLAKQYPSVFNPITEGSNNVPCDSYITGCSLDSNGDGYYSLQGYSAGSGYNLAAGLGSIDVGALMKYWGKITFNSSSTALTITPTTSTHGDNVTVSVAVTSSATGTPSGSVSLVTNSTLSAYQGFTALTLDQNGKASASINSLPGGTYTITAKYSGDGIFAASESAATTVTVATEASSTPLSLQYLMYGSGTSFSSGDSVPFGSAVYADVIPAGASGSSGVATGTVTYLDGNKALGSVALSASGTAEYIASNLSLGAHTFTASYSGDSSYRASKSATISFTVVKGDTFSFAEATGSFSGNYYLGQDIVLVSATDPYTSGSVSPTGTMTITLSNGTTKVCALSAWSQWAISSCDLGSNLPLGTYSFTATYSGDSNFNSSDYTGSFNVVSTSLINSTTTFAITSPTDTSKITDSTPVTLTATVKGPSGSTVAPTGTVRMWDAYYVSSTAATLVAGSGAIATATFMLTPADLASYSTNELAAAYSGDANYNASTSTPIALYNGTGDGYSMTLQSQTLVVASGSTGTGTLNLQSIGSFSGLVSLSCAVPSSANMTCAINPTSLTLSGNATATVTLNAYTTTTTTASAKSGSSWYLGGGIATFAFCFFFTRKRYRVYLASVALLVAMGVFATGCGGSTKSKTTPTTTTTKALAESYSVVVTAIGYNGQKHNVVLTVVVQ